MRKSDFKYNIGDIENGYIITNRERRKGNDGRVYKCYKYKCLNCGFNCGEHYSLKRKEYVPEYWIIEGNIKKGNGCACCKNNNIVVRNINDLNTTSPDIAKYLKNKNDGYLYTKGTGAKLDFVCPDCGNIVKKSPYDVERYGVTCICGDGFSYGHKYVCSVLKQNNIQFIDNVTPEWCRFKKYNSDKTRSGEYDFVIEELKIIIEVDGGFHRRDNNMNGQTKEESQYVDKMKDELAKENGYKIIRVHYNDDKFKIKDSILHTDIVKIINIENTDWVKCEEFAIKNLAKEACSLWNENKDNPYFTVSDVSSIMGKSRNCVLEWLKIGARIGWCDYDPKEENRRSGKRSGYILSQKLNAKIRIKNNGIVIDCDSFKDFIRLDLKNNKLKSLPKLVSVCDKRETFYGYTFEYCDEKWYGATSFLFN